MEEYNDSLSNNRVFIDLFGSRFQNIQKESEKIRKESENIRKESQKIRKESENIRKESENLRKEIENISHEIMECTARLNNAINLLSINFSNNERLSDSLQENQDNNGCEIVNKLEEVELNEQFENIEENKCAICLEIFSIGDKVSYLPCPHYFHSSCIKNWLKIKNKCPYCNNIIKF